MNIPDFMTGVARVVEHLKVGNTTAAEEVCRKMLMTLPQEGQSLNTQGIEAFHSGHYNGLVSSAQILGRAVACCPDEPTFQRNLAIALDAQGRHREASRIRAALTVIPATAFIPALTQVIEHLKAENLLEAESICQRMLETLPYPGLTLNQLGCDAVQAGRTSDGLLLLDRAILSQPEEVQFRQNRAIVLDALGRHAEAREVRNSLNEEPFFVVPVRVLDDLGEWANASGYEARAIPQPPFVMPRTAEILPADIYTMAEDMVSGSLKPAYAVCAEGMRLVSWRLPITKAGAETLMPISKAGDIVWDRQTLGFYTFIRQLTPDNSRCVVDATPFLSKRIRIEEECFFLGGVNHFGHWVADYLANLQALKAAELPTQMPIVTPLLEDWQRETITCLGLTNRLIELEPPSHCTLIEFDRAWMANGYSLPERYRFLRSVFSASVSEMAQRNASALPTRIYVSRGQWRGANRVANEDAVCAYLIARGFAIVYPEQLGIRRSAELFGGAEIIVVGPGAHWFNHFVFAPASCLLVSLYPDALFKTGLGMERHLYWHIPFLDNIVYVVGHSLGRGSGMLIDDAATYPIEAIATAIDQAEDRIRK